MNLSFRGPLMTVDRYSGESNVVGEDRRPPTDAAMEYYSRSRVKRLLQCDEFMKRSLTFLVIATCTTVGCCTPGQTGAGAVQAAGRPLVSVTLVESAPVETTLDHPDVPNASEI